MKTHDNGIYLVIFLMISYLHWFRNIELRDDFWVIDRKTSYLLSSSFIGLLNTFHRPIPIWETCWLTWVSTLENAKICHSQKVMSLSLSLWKLNSPLECEKSPGGLREITGKSSCGEEKYGHRFQQYVTSLKTHMENLSFSTKGRDEPWDACDLPLFQNCRLFLFGLRHIDLYPLDKKIKFYKYNKILFYY